MTAQAPHRILILGGGFAGVYTAAHLERVARRDPRIEVTLVSRHNYFVMTPLLFEAGSGVLDPRHAVTPIRRMLDPRAVRFLQADVRGVDLERRLVTATKELGGPVELPYDQLVLALGGVTNTPIVPGSENALTFKTLGDAIHLRNQTIQRFEVADAEADPARRRALLTFVVVGAGFVGVELVGELSSFVRDVARVYRNVRPEDVRIEIVEPAERIAPEFDPELTEFAADALTRRGVRIRVRTRVVGIAPGVVRLEGGEAIEAGTIVVVSGVIPSPVVLALPIEKDGKGRVRVDATMRSVGRPEVWALGDCATIPDPSGRPYPPLAQHALREARRLAGNVAAVLRGAEPAPFVYHTKGTLAALGRHSGIGRIYGFRIRGILAWWIWRTYYLFQMPRWDRRLRIILDWTIALWFRSDVVQLDLTREREEIRDR